MKRFLVAKLLYKYKCPSLCHLRLRENVNFLDAILDRGLPFLVQIPLIYYIFLPSVCQPGHNKTHINKGNFLAAI